MSIFWVFKTDVFCSERLVCYIKRRKSFFHDLFSQSMTWEYTGLQGVTGGYKGLQGVTRGYRGKRKLEMDLPKKELNQTIYVVNFRRKT